MTNQEKENSSESPDHKLKKLFKSVFLKGFSSGYNVGYSASIFVYNYAILSRKLNRYPTKEEVIEQSGIYFSDIKNSILIVMKDEKDIDEFINLIDEAGKDFKNYVESLDELNENTIKKNHPHNNNVVDE